MIQLKSGGNTKKISDRKFLLAAYARNTKDEDCSVFAFKYRGNPVEVTAISVDHINQPAQEVILSICLFEYRV